MTRSFLQLSANRMLIVVASLFWFEPTFSQSHEQVVEEYACFNTIFEIVCPSEADVVIFESARYGRNDTLVAALCEIPFTRNCDIDVHFLLNRACAGRRKCSIAVNTAFFGDPCGYEEFLKVTYRCVPASMIQSRCSETEAVPLYNSGYITSPNYPNKYYMDAECRWVIYVQRRQTIRITLFDFELDVKRGGRCFDHLEVSSGERTFFRDCGALGRQVVEIDSSCSHVLVTFRTGQTSLTQRGFLLYYEGHGCPSLPDGEHRVINYFIESDTFYANVSCTDGFFLDDGIRPNSARIIECVDFFWNGHVPQCVANIVLPPPPPTPPYTITGRSNQPTAHGDRVKSALDRSAPLVGVTLAVVLAIIAITLVLITTMYCCHKRWRHQSINRKQRHWSMMINNLREESLPPGAAEPYYAPGGGMSDAKIGSNYRNSRCYGNGFVNVGGGGSSSLQGVVNGSDLYEVKGHRTYVSAAGVGDEDWTCRRLLIPTPLHTCNDDDDTMATLMDRYGSVVNNSSPSGDNNINTYCPVCSPATRIGVNGVTDSLHAHYNHYISSNLIPVSIPTITSQSISTNSSNGPTVERTTADYSTSTVRPDLLRPVASLNVETTASATRAGMSEATSSTLWSPDRCNSPSGYAVFCSPRPKSLSSSAPDLIELTRLPSILEHDDVDNDDTDDSLNGGGSDDNNAKQDRSLLKYGTLSFPIRHSSAVWHNRTGSGTGGVCYSSPQVQAAEVSPEYCSQDRRQDEETFLLGIDVTGNARDSTAIEKNDN